MFYEGLYLYQKMGVNTARTLYYTKFFFVYVYQKYSEFYADFKSVEIIGKKCTQKKLFAKNFYKLVV